MKRKDGWASDGWLTIAPNACAIDTQHPDLTSFFYRAELDTYGDNKWTTWGSDREFSVKDGNFRLDRAEQKAPGARFVKFNGPDSYTDPFTMVTLTFLPDFKVTFSVPNENIGTAGGGRRGAVNATRRRRGSGPVKPSDKMDFIPDLPTRATPESDFLPPDKPTPGAAVAWPSNPVPAGNLANETTDWNVAQQIVLQRDVGSPTPLTLPGARRITTQELHEIGPQSLLIDVLDESGNHKTIPSAVHLPGAGNYGRGHLKDGIQKSLSKLLAKLTGNDTGRQIVFFCEGAQCWESYNAALRAIDLGYRNVLWYRGGLESWKAAGLPLVAPGATYPVR